MKYRTGILTLAALFGAAAAAQDQGGYLDELIVKVKPEKRADFDAVSRKYADANRRHKGDTWVAFNVEYGEQNTVYFVSARKNYAAIDDAFAASGKAMSAAFGASASKVAYDWGSCLVSSRGEIRRRRWDLSRNVPSDPAELAKVVGEARFLRTTSVRVRVGHGEAFESMIRELNAAAQKGNDTRMFTVAQSVNGQQGLQYHLTTFYKSYAAMDGLPSLKDEMGAAGYAKWQQESSDNVLSFESVTGRFVPELSNPPEAIAAADPAFWRPKPAPAAKPKAQPAAAPKAGQ